MILAMACAHCSGQAAEASEKLRQTALALEHQGSNSEAEAAWKAFIETHPSSPEPYAHLGLLEARQEHYKEAVPLYRKALALGPKNPGVQLNLGLALFKGGELKQAIQVFTLLLKSQPSASPQAQQLTTLMGMAHYGLGEYAEAAPYLKQAAVGDARNLPLRLALAHSCLWSKQYQCVLDTYHEILALNADSAEADMLAGETLDEIHDSDGAIRQFRAALKADPAMHDVHFGLGYLLWTQRQYQEAASEFQAELANDPNHVQALIYLADANLQMNHPEAAPPLLEKAIGIAPGFELAHLDLGIFYAGAGRPEDAIRELNVAAKLAPKEVNVHWRLARVYQSMGKKDEAKAEFDKASALNQETDAPLLNKLDSVHTKPAQTEQTTAAPPDH